MWQADAAMSGSRQKPVKKILELTAKVGQASDPFQSLLG
jgi:hypothetical protein